MSQERCAPCCRANASAAAQPITPTGQLGLAALLLASMLLRLVLIMVPILVVCRIMALIRSASARARAPATPRIIALDRELQQLVVVRLLLHPGRCHLLFMLESMRSLYHILVAACFMDL